MKLAVISDIHGNLEALQAVLADMDRLGLAQIVSLGDNIGYGPDPEAVMESLRTRDILSIMGNHELALIDSKSLDLFNPLARDSLLQTKALLSEKSLGAIPKLPLSMTLAGCLLVHGVPPSDVNTYLFDLSFAQLQRIMQSMEKDICMVGHTHELALLTYSQGKLHVDPLKMGVHSVEEDTKVMVNVGSVGQPRDENNQAKYVIWDTESRTLEVRFVPYDIQKTVEKILAFGFPKINADRLW